jgi:hypothetical protein
MRPLPTGSFRAGLAVLLLATGLLALDQGRAAGPDAARPAPPASALGPLNGFRKVPTPARGEDASERCGVTVEYPKDLPGAKHVILTDLVSDRECPSELNGTEEITFELVVSEPTRGLWWRRAVSSYDMLRPSSGPIAASGRSRVTFQDLVLDDAVTIEVLDGERLLLSFTLRHF